MILAEGTSSHRNGSPLSDRVIVGAVGARLLSETARTACSKWNFRSSGSELDHTAMSGKRTSPPKVLAPHSV